MSYRKIKYKTKHEAKYRMKCIGKTVYTRQLICETRDKVYWACTPGSGFKCTFLAFVGDRHAEVRLESDGRIYETHIAYAGFNPAVTKGIDGWPPCDQILSTDPTNDGKESSRYIYQTLTLTRKRSK